MKRTEVIIVILALALFGAGLLMGIPGERFGSRAEMRFVLRFNGNLVAPDFAQHHSQAISNVLVESFCVRALADASSVRPSDFKLIGVGPVPGTSAIYVRYAGSDRHGVERVASNSFNMLGLHYFNNNRMVIGEYLETTVIKRFPSSRNLREERSPERRH